MRTRERFQNAVLTETQAALWDTGFTSRSFLAEHQFEDVLRREPSFTPAALHLGRLRLLEGKPDKAAALLSAAATGEDPRVRYLALLFSGAIHERGGRVAQAEHCYREAVAEYPRGQSAVLALSALLDRHGRSDDARVLVEAHFTRDQKHLDPLWTYLAQPERQRALLFDELRDEVSR